MRRKRPHAKGPIQTLPKSRISPTGAFEGAPPDVRISPQKTEELHRRLEQESRLFNTTLSSITDFVYIFDREGRFVYVNQALLDLWGLKLEEAVGKNFYDLKYPDELAGKLQQQIQQVFDTKTGLRDETPYTSPTGAGGYYEYIFRPVFDRDGNTEVVAGSTRDITERKRVEEELRQSQERYRVLAETLENQVRARTSELEQRNNDVVTQSERLQHLSVRLMNLQDAERRHIARELHDSAGQTMALMMMNLAQMLTEIENVNPALLKVANETRALAEDLNKEIRTTSYLLHPPLLDEIGLRAALSWYVDGLKERAGIVVELTVDGEFGRPSREIELNIFRIVQECLTNIHRHSGSKTASIRIARDSSNVIVEVRDAGRGIASADLDKINAKGAGVGLRGIRERVRQLGGYLSIESQPGSGTTILVTLPSASAPSKDDL